MWAWLTPTLSVLGAGLVTLLATYINSKRQRSGRIQTSEASELWKESSTLRQELFSQVSALRDELTALRDKNVVLQENLAAMRLLHEDCERKLNAISKRLERPND